MTFDFMKTLGYSKYKPFPTKNSSKLLFFSKFLWMIQFFVVSLNRISIIIIECGKSDFVDVFSRCIRLSGFRHFRRQTSFITSTFNWGYEGISQRQ